MKRALFLSQEDLLSNECPQETSKYNCENQFSKISLQRVCFGANFSQSLQSQGSRIMWEEAITTKNDDLQAQSIGCLDLEIHRYIYRQLQAVWVGAIILESFFLYCLQPWFMSALFALMQFGKHVYSGFICRLYAGAHLESCIYLSTQCMGVFLKY